MPASPRRRCSVMPAANAAGLPHETPITDEMREVRCLLEESTKDEGYTDHPYLIAYGAALINEGAPE